MSFLQIKKKMVTFIDQPFEMTRKQLCWIISIVQLHTGKIYQGTFMDEKKMKSFINGNLLILSKLNLNVKDIMQDCSDNRFEIIKLKNTLKECYENKFNTIHCITNNEKKVKFFKKVSRGCDVTLLPKITDIYDDSLFKLTKFERDILICNNNICSVKRQLNDSIEKQHVLESIDNV
jgi:hypothetical protein